MSYAEAQYTIDEVLAGVKDMQVAGNEPNNLKNINIIGGDSHNFISFEAQDTMIDGQVVTTTVGVICRRKLGAYPDDENDGDLVFDASGAELGAYISTPFIDEGLENDVTYFYRFFPYTAYGMMNRSLNNTATATPHDATIWGFHQDFTNLDPDSCITYIESAKGYNPMRTNVSRSTYSLGSWGEWDWIKKNRPFVINKNRELLYSLKDGNYMTLTNDSTLSSSAVEGSSWNGDFVTWIPKIYMKEVYAEDGNSRDVLFALTREGETWDYIPVGFHNKNGEELEGLWIPMFYPCAADHRSIYNRAPYNSGGSVETVMSTKLPTRYGEDNSAALGGPILNMLRDLLYMLYKSTNIQKHNGDGFANRTSSMSSNTGVTINTKSGGDATYGFWGQTAASGETGNASRLFHSVVLGAMYTSIVDPYFYVKGGFLWGCKNYKGNIATGSDEHYVQSSNIYYGTSAQSNSKYPSKLAYFGDGYGSLPVVGNNDGGSDTGLTDSLYFTNTDGTLPYIVVRFGHYNTKYAAGPAHMRFTHNKGSVAGSAQFCMSHIIFPDVGFDPTV